jgi:ABC-2 type transport system ATP-binding protein
MHGPIDEVYRRIKRNRLLEIRVIDKFETALSIVRSLPETLDVQVDNHKITAELAAEDHQVAGLLERLVSSGVRMNSFSDKDPTLEDVFMLVTKGLVI